MFIRYHLFYYAIGCLLVVLGRFYHPIFYFVFMMIGLWGLWRFGWKYLSLLLILSGMLFLLPIHISELPSQLSGKVVKVSENYCYLKTDIGTVKLYHDEQLEYNDLISVNVKPLDMNENTNDYAFNEKLYLYGQRVFYKATCQRLLTQEHNPSFYHWLQQRFSNQTQIQDYQRLFLLGERSESIENDYQQLAQLSLVHLFALSGMHIHILVLGFKRIFGLFFQQFLSRLFSYFCLAIYIFSLPMQISLYRAFFVLVLYDLFKKWFHELDILSFLVIVSLFYNPYIIYNISFIFSYFIYFIVILTKQRKNSSLLIYTSTLPIILNLNYQIPLISYLVSSFLTPYIEIFYGLCWLSVLGLWSIPILSVWISLFQSLLSFLDALTPFLSIAKPNLLFIVVYYIIYFLILYSLELKQPIQKYIAIMLALFISIFVYSRYKIYGEITMIDVGQGDCTLIRLPMNQGNILIDTGGIKDYDLATQTLIPYFRAIGIEQLDYVYISHNDYDHCGALTSLQEHFPIKHIIESYEQKRQIGCATIQMLKSDHIYTEKNDQSLVMYVQLPACSLLLTGDASTQVESDLSSQLQNLDVDILKVSHHGSRSATSSQFLNDITPSIAMIGVKKNNLYHHPSDEVIERLQRKKITILRTDQDGMFHIRFYGKSRYILK